MHGIATCTLAKFIRQQVHATRPDNTVPKMMYVIFWSDDLKVPYFLIIRLLWGSKKLQYIHHKIRLSLLSTVLHCPLCVTNLVMIKSILYIYIRTAIIITLYVPYFGASCIRQNKPVLVKTMTVLVGRPERCTNNNILWHAVPSTKRLGHVYFLNKNKCPSCDVCSSK